MNIAILFFPHPQESERLIAKTALSGKVAAVGQAAKTGQRHGLGCRHLGEGSNPLVANPQDITDDAQRHHGLPF
jgi:hypothetical protein